VFESEFTLSDLRRWLVRVGDNHGCAGDGGLSSKLTGAVEEGIRFANEDLIKIVDEVSTGVFDDSAKEVLSSLQHYLHLDATKVHSSRPLSEAVRAILSDGSKVGEELLLVPPLLNARLCLIVFVTTLRCTVAGDQPRCFDC
jgi:hypothetical protein